MNITALFAFYFANSQAQFVKRDINQEIAQSLRYVIEKFFVERSSSFVLIVSCQREHTMNFYKELLEILFANWCNIKTQIVVNSDSSGANVPSERIVNMLLVDSSESFLQIDPASKVQNYDINEYYYVFLQNRDRFLPDDIQRILNYCWRHYIINVNIEVQLGTAEIIVYTYFPFTAEHCGKVVPVEINRFQNGTMTNDVLFPQKVRNMFRCPIKVATWHSPPHVILAPNSTKLKGGFEGDLLMQLGDVMNFDIEVAEPPNNEKRGTISGNQTTGAFRMLRERQADLTLAYIWFTGIRSSVATPSDSYHKSRNVAVLLGYDSYFELIQSNWVPFHWKALSVILFSFVVTLCTLLGLANMEQFSQLVCDLRHRNVLLSHIASSLGLPSFIEPKRSWIRIFLMNWMICTLIVRTCYGAMLFHFIRSNLFRRTPTKLEDVLRLNYTYVFERAALEAIKHTSILTETGLKYIVNPSNSLVYVFLEQHPHEKFLTIAPMDFVLHYVLTNRKAGYYSILKQSLMSQNCCMYFTKHSFLVDRVNHILRRIAEVGLLEAWRRKYFDPLYLVRAKGASYVAIGMPELRGVFYICCWMWLAAGVVFCLEVVSVRVKEWRRLGKILRRKLGRH